MLWISRSHYSASSRLSLYGLVPSDSEFSEREFHLSFAIALAIASLPDAARPLRCRPQPINLPPLAGLEIL